MRTRNTYHQHMPLTHMHDALTHTPPGEPRHAPEQGVLVGPGVNAQHHQHMFCARIDPAVDDEEGGKAVLVKEVRTVCVRCVLGARGWVCRVCASLDPAIDDEEGGKAVLVTQGGGGGVC